MPGTFPSWKEITSITEPGKFLFVGPGQEVPSGLDTTEYRLHETPTNSIFLGIRLIPTDPDERLALLNNVEIYPYAERVIPNPRGYITPKGKRWSAAHPRGMEFWQRLSDIISKEPVLERDRFFMAMLAPLGIEKGKPFNPTPRQKRILTEGVLVGEAMAKAIDFEKSPRSRMRTIWTDPGGILTRRPRRSAPEALRRPRRPRFLVLRGGHRQPRHARHGDRQGPGLPHAYKDDEGDWLDGAKNYTLHIPPDAPARAVLVADALRGGRPGHHPQPAQGHRPVSRHGPAHEPGRLR